MALLKGKIEFSTQMYNLKEKGNKVTQLMHYNQKLIRERKMDTKEDFDDIIDKMAEKRNELGE
jgi:hypothetical protein